MKRQKCALLSSTFEGGQLEGKGHEEDILWSTSHRQKVHKKEADSRKIVKFVLKSDVGGNHQICICFGSNCG